MALGWKKQYLRYKNFFLDITLLYKRKSEVKMFVEILLSLITLTILSIFALRPTLVTISQLLKDIKTKEEVLSLLTTKINALNQAQKNYDQEKNNIPLVDYAIPEKPNAESLIRQIELLAGQNSVQILNFTFDKLTLIGKQTPLEALTTEGLTNFPPDSGSVALSLTVSSNFEALAAFEKGLENLRRPIRIDLLKIISIATETGITQNMTISGRSPFLIVQ